MVSTHAALAWPLWLTKLNYLIDNPWSNATERARTAGLILADTLIQRQLGVRPITLVGYSLGARMIFYALLELSRRKAFGIVQNVYLMGAPITAREHEWALARSAVSGRFVNAYSRSDWLLAYLHRATAGGVRSIAGLHPVTFDCKIENVDVTHLVPGHLAYRALTPLVLGELGFKTTADYFDEPESLANVPEREHVKPTETPAPPKSTLFRQWFQRKGPTAPAGRAQAEPDKARGAYEPDKADEGADGEPDMARDTCEPDRSTIGPQEPGVTEAPAPNTAHVTHEPSTATDASPAPTEPSPDAEANAAPHDPTEAPAPDEQDEAESSVPSEEGPPISHVSPDIPPAASEADTQVTPSYAQYGLSSGEASRLAHEFQNVSLGPSPREDTPASDTMPLPAWAEDNPW